MFMADTWYSAYAWSGKCSQTKLWLEGKWTDQL